MLLVDGNSIMNNCFFGMPLLSTADGMYTNAVTGTVNVLLKYLKELSPEYCAVAFDVHEPTFRHKAYGEYKAGRHSMPEELKPQFPVVKECVGALGIAVVEAPGYEADDILGTFAAYADGLGAEAYIITGDKDSFQLIRDNVTVLYKGRNGINPVGRKEFGERYPGVTPEIFTHYKALLGDTSDNIKGVNGIGEKSALELISTYHTLDGIYEHIGSIKKAWATKLESGRDDAYFSLYLSTIKCDSPIGLSADDIRYRGPDRGKCGEVFTKYRMMKALETVNFLFGEDEKTVESKEKFSSFETVPFGETALEPGKKSLFGNFLFDGKNHYMLNSDGVRTVLMNPQLNIAVEDCKTIYSEYENVRAELFDVPLASYIVDSSESNPTLSRLAVKYFGTSVGESFDGAKLLFDLREILEKKLDETKQREIYNRIELPLTGVLAKMEKEGFRVDRSGLRAFSAELGGMCEKYTAEIYAMAGHPFNVNSTKQLASVLFDELNLPHGKKTQSGYSTGIETLEKIREFHPIVNKIIEYRKISKLLSAYTEGLLSVADSDGRIHSTFNQKIAATGRLSSSDPNLQNIPIRTELGKKMREYFIARDGYVLVDADYSQIELRVLAAVSGDRNMINSFLLGEDIHRSTAASVFHVPISSVTPEQRKQAKAINFGIMYGMSAFSLAEDIGVSRYAASEYIKNYLAGFPEISSFLSETVQFAKENGYVMTEFGRRRSIPELLSPKKTVQAAGERIARNSPIQGSAADIIKIAMINVSSALKKEGLDAKLILQVHDELIIEARTDEAEKAAKLLKREMENAVELAVPLTVEVGIGRNWLECH